MKKLLDVINFLLDKLFKLFQIYSKVVLLAIVIIVSAQVVSRKFFNYSIIWSEEVALLFMVWMAFIALAIGVAKDIHIRIAMFYNWFPKSYQKAFRVIERIATLLVGWVLLKNGMMLVMYTLHSTLPTTKWPSFTLYLMIPISGFYIIYITVLQIFFPNAAKLFKYEENSNEGAEG